MKPFNTIRVERDLPVPMADGTVLRAEVWRPDDDAPRPAILVRTPYLKELDASAPILDSRLATARGYAVVLQDVRGRGASEGAFEPFANEEADGAESVAWTAAQPWCDGRVVMGGMSYVGATQWLAAVARPPALRAIAPTLSSDEFGEGWALRFGVVEHGFLGTWSAADLAAPDDRWGDAPERAYDDVAGLADIAPWTRTWLGHDSAAYWSRLSVARRRDSVDVPVLYTGGWYDVFLAGTLAGFARSRDPGDRLVIGPWGHDWLLSNIVGDLNAGAAGNGFEWFGWALDFFDAVLAGGEPSAPRVRAYLLGARRWLELPSWPPPGAAPTTLALHPGSVEVHPDDPVPSLGGRGLLVQVPGEGWGVRDQRPVLGRPDVVAAGRTARPHATTLAGPVRARLSIGAEGTEPAFWAVTLCVERPDGALHNLCEGVARAPADATHVDVELGDVCIEIAPGEALVTLIAGSSFPRWPRPPADRAQHVLEGSLLEVTIAELGR
jgi:uncharacterized protein